MHGRWRNLVVMATGTGKTVVAALDYQRLREPAAGRVAAVRRAPATRSSGRAGRRSGTSSGTAPSASCSVGGERPRRVAARLRLRPVVDRLDLAELDPDALRHGDRRRVPPRRGRRRTAGCSTGCGPRCCSASPRPRSGRTAGDVREWFDGRTAVELRLWEALERGLLAPFQYFGLHDDVDLSHAALAARPGYDTAELDERLHRQRRAGRGSILQALPTRWRTRAGCARWRSASASSTPSSWRASSAAAGIPARAVTSRTDDTRRRTALERPPATGRSTCSSRSTCSTRASTCPTVDTILLLRPDRERHGLPAAARPRAAAGRRTSLPDRARLHRRPAPPSSASTCASGRSPGAPAARWRTGRCTASPRCRRAATSSSTRVVHTHVAGQRPTRRALVVAGVRHGAAHLPGPVARGLPRAPGAGTAGPLPR